MWSRHQTALNKTWLEIAPMKINTSKQIGNYNNPLIVSQTSNATLVLLVFLIPSYYKCEQCTYIPDAHAHFNEVFQDYFLFQSASYAVCSDLQKSSYSTEGH